MPEITYSPDPRPSPLQFPPSRGYGSIRDRVTSARTYYVAASGGSDTFDGLSPGGAFATIQKAVDVVLNLDLAALVNVTIQLMDGNHSLASAINIRSMVGIGQIIIQGNANTTSAVTITATAASFQMFQLSGLNGRFVIQHLTMVGSSSNTAIGVDALSRVTIGKMRFGAGFTSALNIANNSLVTLAGSTYEIYGSMAQFALCQRNSMLLATTTGTWTITGTPAWSVAFVYALDQGNIRISSANVTFSGSATGVRYLAEMDSIIQTNGGGANFFPGGSAGSTATGSQYA